MSTISGQSNTDKDYSGILRTVLAYSAINEGTKVLVIRVSVRFTMMRMILEDFNHKLTGYCSINDCGAFGKEISEVLFNMQRNWL